MEMRGFQRSPTRETTRDSPLDSPDGLPSIFTGKMLWIISPPDSISMQNRGAPVRAPAGLTPQVFDPT